jgi:hypothetical protein
MSGTEYGEFHHLLKSSRWPFAPSRKRRNPNVDTCFKMVEPS